MASYIKTDDHITIVFDDGESATVYCTNPEYDTVLTAVRNGNWDTVRDLAIPSRVLKRKVETPTTVDRVTVVGGIVTLDGQPLHNSLTKRLVKLMEEGFDIGPMSKFLTNLMDNPSYRAVNELYEFMEKSDLPITEDGHFIAYKRVRLNWMDQHTEKIDNSIGKIVKMPRNQVDEEKSRLCSSGLHFCSRSYLPEYSSTDGGRIIIVKINPRDVVAIPEDYNQAKGRCCQYEVIGELTKVSESDNTLPKETIEGSFRATNETTTIKTETTPASIATPKEKSRKQPRSVIQYDIDGNFISSFPSVQQASKTAAVNESSIRKVCNGTRNLAGGYKWKWADSTESIEDENPSSTNQEDYDNDWTWGTVSGRLDFEEDYVDQ